MQNIFMEQLNKSYGDHVIFRDFSCEIPAGKITCLLGPSGVGKTTLLRILMNLEKPDSGRISGLDDVKIAAVFQEDRLCENLTVRTNLELVLDRKSIGTSTNPQPVLDRKSIITSTNPQPATSVEDRIASGLQSMDLKPEVLNQKVSELSGGMKRRVAILRALLSDYDLLILDEPFKGLDEELKQKVMDYVWQSANGKTVIFVTHDTTELERLDKSNTVVNKISL